jgi:hypothetical protein
MLHPAWLGENLFMLLLVDRNDLPAVIKYDKTVAGCTLI